MGSKSELEMEDSNRYKLPYKRGNWVFCSPLICGGEMR